MPCAFWKSAACSVRDASRPAAPPSSPTSAAFSFALSRPSTTTLTRTLTRKRTIRRNSKVLASLWTNVVANLQTRQQFRVGPPLRRAPPRRLRHRRLPNVARSPTPLRASPPQSATAETPHDPVVAKPLRAAREQSHL